MPKPKQFLKSEKKRGTKAAHIPQTADEYLAAGVEFEEAGEKWRGGDAAKSTRFFVRAINCYDEALQKFPTSFDLAYNKARVQYELTQHPKLANELPAPLIDLLSTALQSSRAALALNGENADVLFNTAQVLTSLVEVAQTERLDSSRHDTLPLVYEALELFQQCFKIQVTHYAGDQAFQEQMRTQQESPRSDDTIPDSQETISELSSSSPRGTSTAEDDRWALAVEPVTLDTLLDTLLAQMETLATLASLVNGAQSKGLEWIEQYSTSLLTTLPTYLQNASPEREAEAALARANFVCAFADANYYSGRIELTEYEHVVFSTHNKLKLDEDAEGLSDHAEALLSFDSALRFETQRGGTSGDSPMRWKTLSAALQLLTAASKLAANDNTAKIHMARGDTELLRYQLGFAPWSHKAAAASAAVLVKNAGTFYRGAEAHALASNQKKVAQEAILKQAVVASIEGADEKLKAYIKTQPVEAESVLRELIEEGLLTLEWIHGKGFSTH